MSENKSKNIGAIWAKTTKAGAPMLSMRIEIEGKTYNFTALENMYKDGVEKRPDWNILPPREMPAATPTSEPSNEDLDQKTTSGDIADAIPF